MAKRAALGFSVHTGWAVMVAVGSTDRAVLDRRRIVLISGEDRDRPRFVFHAASKLPFEPAERLVADSTELAYANALAELRSAMQELDVVSCGIITGGRPLTASLESILRSHALIHTAEGVLFREALRRACEALGIAAVQVRSRELRGRGAAAVGVAEGKMDDHLAAVGRATGKPWGKDHRDAFVAAAIALAPRARVARHGS
jgi:hypothetical protein